MLPSLLPINCRLSKVHPIWMMQSVCKWLIRRAAPEETCFRKPLLYPSELQGHCGQTYYRMSMSAEAGMVGPQQGSHFVRDLRGD